MSLQKPKILLAPLLAVILALLLVGATQSFPPAQQEQTVTTQGGGVLPQPTEPPKALSPPSVPSSTDMPNFTLGEPSPSAPTGDSATPRAPPKPTAVPSATTESQEGATLASTSAFGFGGDFQWVFLAAAIVVAVVAVWLFSSERKTKDTVDNGS